MLNYYNLSYNDTIKELKSNSQTGLSPSEVKTRQNKYGENKLTEKEKINPFILFINQFKSFIIYILIFAVIISFISKEYTEAIIILIILVFNAVFGFLQEYRAEKSIEALRKISALKTRVLRNEQIIQIDVSELVPGDIVILEEGDKIPADCRIIECKNLSVEEAALTGESVPVSKQVDEIKGNLTVADRKNMLFSGTIITKGKGRAIVTSIAMETEIGKIANLLNTTENEMTPLQKKLEQFGKWVASATLAICAIIFIVGVTKDGYLPLLFSGQFSEFVFASKDWFLTAISLAVAAVPEGLPAIVTIALALGVKAMVKKNALIRKLPSVETLGETTVICTDKTGTLTKNQMTVRKVWTIDSECEIDGIGYNPQGTLSKKIDNLIFRIGLLCNSASLLKEKNLWKITGDPTEGALLVSAKKADFNLDETNKLWKKIDEEPFDSDRKLMSTINENSKTKEKIVHTKGAPEQVLKICKKILDNGKIRNINDSDKKAILKQNENYASSALRVLGFAYKIYNSKEKNESNLIFVGLQAMIDPPHLDVKEAIAKCNTAGIKVIMITGDNKITAAAIGKEIGIVGESMNGEDFAKLSESEKKKIIKKIRIFARVEPIHKMQIVKLLQEQGEVVAMTGDGVNDAPAIKAADMGIAMGINGTDVAKESSEMILLDDKFTSIVNAVEEGRGIYENIKKFVNYLFSSNLAEVLLIFFAIVLGLPLPMTAIMLLWLNLVTDGLPALALSADPKSDKLMSKPPKKASEGIMDKEMMFHVVYVGILITIAILALIVWAQNKGFSLEKIQTIAFTAIIVMELVRLQAIRTEYNLGPFSNPYLVWAVCISLILQLIVIYTPINIFFGTVFLGFTDWTMILGATLIVFLLNTLGNFIQDKYHFFEN